MVKCNSVHTSVSFACCARSRGQPMFACEDKQAAFVACSLYLSPSLQPHTTLLFSLLHLATQPIHHTLSILDTNKLRPIHKSITTKPQTRSFPIPKSPHQPTSAPAPAKASGKPLRQKTPAMPSSPTQVPLPPTPTTAEESLPFSPSNPYTNLSRSGGDSDEMVFGPIPDREYHAGFMRKAIDMAELALRSDETPVGCVFVRDGEVIGRGINGTNASLNVSFFFVFPFFVV